MYRYYTNIAANPEEPNDKIRFLNQSFILHLVARWQVFIEDQIRYSFDEMINRDYDSSVKTILRLNVENLIKMFKTPNRKNIDDIFFNVIGLKKLSSAWSYDNTLRETAVNMLEEIVQTRACFKIIATRR
jgi:hypothetical protein